MLSLPKHWILTTGCCCHYQSIEFLLINASGNSLDSSGFYGFFVDFVDFLDFSGLFCGLFFASSGQLWGTAIGHRAGTMTPLDIAQTRGSTRLPIRVKIPNTFFWIFLDFPENRNCASTKSDLWEVWSVSVRPPPAVCTEPRDSEVVDNHDTPLTKLLCKPNTSYFLLINASGKFLDFWIFCGFCGFSGFLWIIFVDYFLQVPVNSGEPPLGTGRGPWHHWTSRRRGGRHVCQSGSKSQIHFSGFFWIFQKIETVHPQKSDLWEVRSVSGRPPPTVCTEPRDSELPATMIPHSQKNCGNKTHNISWKIMTLKFFWILLDFSGFFLDFLDFFWIIFLDFWHVPDSSEQPPFGTALGPRHHWASRRREERHVFRSRKKSRKLFSGFFWIFYGSFWILWIFWIFPGLIFWKKLPSWAMKLLS